MCVPHVLRPAALNGGSLKTSNMARLARPTVNGYPHQVTQRGNYDQTVFEHDADYRYYLDWLRDSASRYGLAIWAYCLMPNHVHYVCVPKSHTSLARTFNTVHMRYSQYFHRKKGLTGHLWRGRFLSCILDDPSVFEEVRFIETNPIRWGLVAHAEDYAWSSARSHVEGTPDPVLRNGSFLADRIGDWREYLLGVKNEIVLGQVRRNLKTGRPAGDTAFVNKLEELTGRRLEALPRGRPRKSSALHSPLHT